MVALSMNGWKETASPLESYSSRFPILQAVSPLPSCLPKMNYLCRNCEGYLLRQDSRKPTRQENVQADETTQAKSQTCLVCLGVWDDTHDENHPDDSFRKRLYTAIQAAVHPYTQDHETRNNNVFSRQTVVPTVVLPGDMIRRYQAFVTPKVPPKAPPAYEWAQKLKAHTKQILDDTLDQIEREWHSSFAAANDEKLPVPKSMPTGIPAQEELGALAVHVIVTASETIPRPRQGKPRYDHKRRQKRRNMDGPSQGGDARRNLELRLLQKKGIVVWTVNQALEKTGKQVQDPDKTLLQPLTGQAYDIHVAVWRRPFYVKSEYTKIRRDVSQTPFYVVDDGKRRRLGITSVEEEILPVLVKYCGGISEQNSDPTSNTTLFGMAKFHASGREDMDVRMVLPEETEEGAKVTGRPFVCEVTDAYMLPSAEDLERVVLEINHVESGETILSDTKQSYGKNPNGVGIAPGLCFVSSAAFKNLQADTEDKVKHYGCLCWSRDVLPDSNAELREKLGTFPVALEQRTPIRVLHRRSNLIRNRNVLSCRVKRIDDHYFRLYISTDAGTYVKEFVHGDLGRTKPSIGSILSCKADILELDCEGIQIA